MMIFNLIKKDILIVKKYVLIMFAAAVPVSYTHLDVYKRQIQSGIIWFTVYPWMWI